MKKTIARIPAILIWAIVAAMVCANVFGGANIPWLLVFLPALIQLGIGITLVAVFGLLALLVLALKASADRK